MTRRGVSRERMAELAVLGLARIKERQQEGLAFAKRWREQRRFDRLTADQPTAAEPRFPYPHRNCAEW